MNLTGHNLQFSCEPADDILGLSIRAGSFVFDVDSWIVPSDPDRSTLLTSLPSPFWLIGSKQGKALVSYCKYFRLKALGGRPAGCPST